MNDYDLLTQCDAVTDVAYDWWLAGQPKAYTRQLRPAGIPNPSLASDDIAQVQAWEESGRPMRRDQRLPIRKHYMHTDANGMTVLLGEKALADVQRQIEDDAGGLVAYMMRYH